MAYNAYLDKLYSKMLKIRFRHAKRDGIFIQEITNQQLQPLC